MTEPTRPARGLLSEALHREKVGTEDRQKEQLGDSVSGMHGVGVISVVGQDNPDLPVVVRIDHPDPLRHPNSVL